MLDVWSRLPRADGVGTEARAQSAGEFSVKALLIAGVGDRNLEPGKGNVAEECSNLIAKAMERHEMHTDMFMYKIESSRSFSWYH